MGRKDEVKAYKWIRGGARAPLVVDRYLDTCALANRMYRRGRTWGSHVPCEWHYRRHVERREGITGGRGGITRGRGARYINGHPIDQTSQFASAIRPLSGSGAHHRCNTLRISTVSGSCRRLDRRILQWFRSQATRSIRRQSTLTYGAPRWTSNCVG